jgi:hypothetical protein
VPRGLPQKRLPLEQAPNDRRLGGPKAVARLEAKLDELGFDPPPIKLRRTDIVNELVIKNTPLDELYDKLASFRDNPTGFVHWAFPWGEPGTDLENMTGPEDWQLDQLNRIGEAIRAGGAEGCVITEDVASGHGVGKSAEVSWIALWAVSTAADTRGVVTANTDTQLRQKTWAELTKWYSLFIAKKLFKLTATSLSIGDDDERAKKWRIDAAPWSKENTEAFAGLHNQGKRVLIIFDEASAIDDKIWEVARGATTDARTETIWLRYGNPTRTSGQFFKEHNKGTESNERGNIVHHSVRVDSRRVRLTNKEQIALEIQEYGEDSDFVRVRIKGMFPRAGYDNFIAPGVVTESRRRRLDSIVYGAHQLILSIDPARFGNDFTVITLRQGLRVHYQIALGGYDGPGVGGKVLEAYRKHNGQIAAIIYDAIGNGADLDSALRRMQPALGATVLIPVMWNQPAKNSDEYFNQRSEAWGLMKEWLAHGWIPDDDDLATQLTSLLYGYDARMRIQLEGKKEARKRGVKSPDKADSLALSFLVELIDRKITTAKVRPVRQRRVVWSRTN